MAGGSSAGRRSCDVAAGNATPGLGLAVAALADYEMMTRSLGHQIRSTDGALRITWWAMAPTSLTPPPPRPADTR